MNRQKEFTEEGRYTPISKAAEGGSSQTYKAVWVIGEEASTKVDLKTDSVDGIGTIYTNDDPVYDSDPIAITDDGEVEPTATTDGLISVQVAAGHTLYVAEFDGEDGIHPLIIGVTAAPDAAA